MPEEITPEKAQEFVTPEGDTMNEAAASTAFAETQDPAANAVDSGMLKDPVTLFTADDDYHKQTFASVFNAAREVGYNNFFHFMERLRSPYHRLDVEDGTREYVDWIQSYGLRDIPERLAEPVKNAFVMNAMIRNTPLHGAYRQMAAASAGDKAITQFLQRVQDTGTPLPQDQAEAANLLRSLNPDEWEEVFRHAFRTELPEAKNDQERKLIGIGADSLDDLDAHLRDSRTRFKSYTKAMNTLFGGTWSKDYLNQYNTEAMIMKSGMLRWNAKGGGDMPRASEIAMDRTNQLTPIDMVTPSVVQEIFETARQRQAGPLANLPIYDDDGKSLVPAEVLQYTMSDELRAPAYATQEALTPFEKNLLGPFTRAGISIYKALFEEIPQAANSLSRRVDEAFSSIPFVQDAARGTVLRLTGDKDAAVSTERLSQAFLTFFKVSQEQQSFVQTLTNMSVAGFQPAERFKQQEAKSFEAFRVLDAPQRQAALTSFGSANAALAENFANIDKMGEVGSAWLKGAPVGPKGERIDPARGLANLLGYGLGKTVQHLILKPFADVMDDPKLAVQYGLENTLLGAGSQGLYNARHMLMRRVYMANKFNNFTRRLLELSPAHARRIQGLARARINSAQAAGKAADGAFEDMLAVSQTALDEIERGVLSSKTTGAFTDKLRNVWPALSQDLQPLAELVTSKFSPAQGVITNLIRKVAPTFRQGKIDNALLSQIVPDLNDESVRAVSDIVTRAGSQGYTHSEQRRRLRLYRQLTGKGQLTRQERLSVLNGDARAMAEVTPRLAQRRNALNEALAQDPNNPSLNEAVRELNNIESVWRGIVPQRATTFMNDLMQTVERLRTRKLPLHTRAVNSVLQKFYGVTSIQGEVLYNHFDNMINLALDAAENASAVSRNNAWKGVLVEKLYRTARHKATNALEVQSSTLTGLRALKEAGENVDDDLALYSKSTVDSQDAVVRLNAEYDRLFKRDDNGELVFRADPRQAWSLDGSMELWKYVNEDTLYNLVKMDPSLVRGFTAEALFDSTPLVARPGEAARLQADMAQVTKDIIGLQKKLVDPVPLDSTLKILELNRDSTAAAAKRAEANVPYALEAVSKTAWARRLNAAKQANHLTTLEHEIHGIIKNRVTLPVRVDNFGRSIDVIRMLDESDFVSAVRAGRFENINPNASEEALAGVRAQLLRVAEVLDNRYDIQPPLLEANGARRGAAAEKWSKLRDNTFDFGAADPRAAQLAADTYRARLQGLKDGTETPMEVSMARRDLTTATDALRQLQQRYTEIRDPRLLASHTLAPEGRQLILRNLNHAGMDEVTERTLNNAEGFRAGVQALVQNRSGVLGALAPFLPSHIKGQTSTMIAKTYLYDNALNSLQLERLNEAYWGMTQRARDVLGAAQRRGVYPSELVKEIPSIKPVVDDMFAKGNSLDDLFKFEENFQHELIDRLRKTGYLDDEMFSELVKRGYDPQLKSLYETAKFVDDPIIRQVREARRGTGPGKPGASGVDIDGLRFARHPTKFRARIKEADGQVKNHFFDSEDSLRDFLRTNYGERAEITKLDDVTRFGTSLKEEVTIARPFSEEALRVLEPILGNTADKRLLRWSELNRNIAIHDFLSTMKLMTGMVFDDRQMLRLEQQYGPKILSEYIRLPDSPSHFGNLSGNFVHRRVLADLNSMSKSYRQVESWIDGMREGFELFNATMPNEILRQGRGTFRSMFDKVNRMARFNLINLNLRTRIANHLFAFLPDHLMGTRLFSLKNLDVRTSALNHIFKKTPDRFDDPMYQEFTRNGLLDQGFEARNWSAPEVDAHLRMLGLPRTEGFTGAVSRIFGGSRKKAAATLKKKLDERHALLQEKLMLMEQGKDPGALSALEQQIVALDSAIEELDTHYIKGLAREAVGFYGTAGSRTVLRTPGALTAERLREGYSATDTFYKYGFYRVLRTKMGVPEKQATELVKRFTQQFRDLPPLLHSLQDNPLGSFVVGFPAEMLRISANAMRNRPGRFLAWLGVVPALNFTMASSAGIDPTRQMKHLEAMGWRDRFSMIRNYMTQLIVPGPGGNIDSVFDLGNVFFPVANMVFNDNAMTHIYDNTLADEPGTRPLFQDVLRAGASVMGAFIGNNPLIDTVATAFTRKNPRTGQRIFSDYDTQGLSEHLLGTMKMVAKQFLSPHTPVLGRDWQNLAEAYEAGYDPVTKRPRALTPGDVTMRAALNIPTKGNFARFVEKSIGEAGKGVAEVMSGPGKLALPPAGKVKGMPTASEDTDVLRSIIVRVADLNGTGDKIRATEQAPIKAAEDLYFRVAKEGNQPEVWEKIGKLLTLPTRSKPSVFGPSEVTQRGAPDVARNLETFSRRGWDDQYSVLDPEEKILAMIQADAAGVADRYIREMARLFVETDFGNARKASDLHRLQNAQRRMDEWVTEKRARRSLFEQPANPDVISVSDYLSDAVLDATDFAEDEAEKRQDRAALDVDLGRPRVTP